MLSDAPHEGWQGKCSLCRNQCPSIQGRWFRLGFLDLTAVPFGVPQPHPLEQLWALRTRGSCALRSLIACAFLDVAGMSARFGAVM